MKRYLHNILAISAGKPAGMARAQMPPHCHFVAFFAAVLIFASCSKETSGGDSSQDAGDTRWWVNTELPVPVQFGYLYDTKSAAIDALSELEGKDFGLFAVGDYKRKAPILYNATAKFHQGKVLFPNTEDHNLYYPLESVNNYSFYAYYFGGDDVTYSAWRNKEGQYLTEVKNLGYYDILWSEPAVAKTLTLPSGDKVTGYNAAYARAAFKWFGNLYSPKLQFKHVCSAIQFHLRFNKEYDSDVAQNSRFRVESYSINFVPTSADLNLNTGEFVSRSQSGTLKYDSILLPDEAGVMAEDVFFIVPGEYPHIDVTLRVRRSASAKAEDIKLTHEQIAQAMQDNVVFERGGRYIFDIYIQDMGLNYNIDINPYR